MPIFSRAHSWVAGQLIKALDHNDNWAGLEQFLNVTKLDETNLQPQVVAGISRAVPVGALVQYAGATAPAGWALCDGRALSRTGFSALFSALGTTYGAGDGSTTFNIPDLRGRVPVGADAMGGTDAGRLSVNEAVGAAGGEERHTLNNSEIPYYNIVTHSGASTYDWTVLNTGSPYVALHAALNIDYGIGGNGAHNNMQPYQVINYIIRTD
jgi:microcystin-dependent protein